MPITQLGGFGADPLRTLASWAQTLGVDWEDSLDETVAFLRKRLSGDYAVDEFGFDPEFTTKIFCRRCGGLLIPGSGSRSEGRRTFPLMARRCWFPTTPAHCRSTG